MYKCKLHRQQKKTIKKERWKYFIKENSLLFEKDFNNYSMF